MKAMGLVPFRDVAISGGFWGHRQSIIADTTIYAVMNRFKDTGRFEAFEFGYQEGDAVKPHIFWDSDIAKWMESAAYILQKKKDPVLEEQVDTLVDLIEAHQEPDGYFNIYFTVVEPGKRFTRRDCHELYCAGHLMEAAVAYNQATGKSKFLKLMCKYADLIEKVFMLDHSATFTTPGHPEIELALVKLYRATHIQRYLALATFFIDNRGTGKENVPYTEWCNELYAQDQYPLREQDTATGHAVRAAYLYCGMADIARENRDLPLKKACRKLFENIVNCKMYITGGIGSSAIGEAFTIDYDLPNKTAYSESCAALALAWFAQRMTRMDPDGLYADVVERILYNGALSGISLDGTAFFYENPLEVSPRFMGKDTSVNRDQTHFPITQRVEVFDCSCCPPNITRFISSVGDFLYTYNEETLFIHQYMQSETTTNLNGEPATILQQTPYPHDGRVNITVTCDTIHTIALRIPSWCKKYTLEQDGKPIMARQEKGYVYVSVHARQSNLVLNMEMPPFLVEANPHVQEDAGRVALQRGPIVYCLEQIDNGINLRGVRIDRDLECRLSYDDLFDCDCVFAKGYQKRSFGENCLYRPLEHDDEQEMRLRFIPYYAFANRGEGEMIVWVRQ